MHAGGQPQEVKFIWLTASGGPFRHTPLEQFAAITPEQALKHPTWVMGRRITVDSATMLNKGLEIMEACRLFDVPPSKVRVTIHPQSTVHSLVEYVDGSILAQISVTDMRLPILYALAYPERPASNLTFDLAALRHLDFEEPDFERFPCLRLAYEAAEKGGAHCIALNAADEVAVEAFLERRIPFTGIPDTIEKVLASTPEAHPGDHCRGARRGPAGASTCGNAGRLTSVSLYQDARKDRLFTLCRIIHEFAVSVISFIVLIGVMVVVHEFGHFAVAKLCGVRVEAFSIGFGPRLFGVKHGDTDYKVCLLPLGRLRENDRRESHRGSSSRSNDPGAFTSHPRWQRMLIGLAGPVANFILAFVLMFFYYNWINEVPKYWWRERHGMGIARFGGGPGRFQTGDVITHFDGSKNPNWIQISTRASMNLNQNGAGDGDPRTGRPVQLSMHMPRNRAGRSSISGTSGILPQSTPGPIERGRGSPGTPADKAGLKGGDQIVSVDGHAVP